MIKWALETYWEGGQPILLVLFNMLEKVEKPTLGHAASPSLVRSLYNTGLVLLMKLCSPLCYDTVSERLPELFGKVLSFLCNF